jgi:hypothetical protein
MKESLHPDVIAALLDGTLDASERQAVIDAILASPDEYEAFVEVVRTLRALEAQAPAPPAAHVPDVADQAVHGAGRKRRAASWALIGGATLAAAAILATLILRGPESWTAIVFAERGVGSIERTFGAAWANPGWGAPRGAQEGTATAVGYRAGVLSTRLDLAAGAGDEPVVRASAAELAALLRTTPELAAIAGPFDAATRTGEPPPAAETNALRGALERPAWYDLGRSVERTRLLAAADRGDVLQQSAAELQAASTAVAGDPELGAPIAERLQQAIALLADPDAAGARSDVQRLLAEVTRLASQ